MGTALEGIVLDGDDGHRTPRTTDRAHEDQCVGEWLSGFRSENTRAAYARDLAHFREYLAAFDLELLAVSRVHVDTYVHGLTATGASAATVSRRLSAVSSFYRRMVQDGVLEKNPATDVQRPRVDADSTSTDYLDGPEAERLLEAAKHSGPRNHAFVRLLLTTGVRVSEALNAHESDLGREDGAEFLRVRRKGGKLAKVYLPARTLEALRTMLETTGRELATGQEIDRLLFTTATGRSWDRHEAAKTLARLVKRAGIEKTITPHSLRHSHATLALDLQVPLRDLQDSLGHADPRTTRRYDRDRDNLRRSSARKVGALFG